MEKKRIIAVGILLAALAAVWLGGTAAVRNGADHTSGAYDYGAAGRKGRCTDS